MRLPFSATVDMGLGTAGATDWSSQCLTQKNSKSKWSKVQASLVRYWSKLKGQNVTLSFGIYYSQQVPHMLALVTQL